MFDVNNLDEVAFQKSVEMISNTVLATSIASVFFLTHNRIYLFHKLFLPFAFPFPCQWTLFPINSASLQIHQHLNPKLITLI